MKYSVLYDFVLLLFAAVPLASPLVVKDKYLNTEDVHVGPCFDHIKTAAAANDTMKLINICEEFHELAGMGRAIVTSVRMVKEWLAFQVEPSHPPIQIDALRYEIEDHPRANKNGTVFYITEGIRMDCVYYLQPTTFNKTLFHLTEDICGVSKSVFG